MNTIYFNGPKSLFADNIRDNLSDPFFYLRDYFKELGFIVKNYEGEAIRPGDHCLFIDYTSAFPYAFGSALKTTIRSILKGEKVYNLYKLACKAGIRKNCILLLWEGPAVSKYYYDKNVRNSFEKILTWNDDLVDGKTIHKFFLPGGFNSKFVEKNVCFDEKKFMVNISMNKKSKWPSELYTERKKAVLFFDKYYPNDFDLYGYGWESENISTYRGKAINKIDTTSKYKFALCYENNGGLKGYITEKIFDCMKAGTVPIYLGADNICDYVDSGCFVDKRDFKSYGELSNFLIDINEQEYETYILAIKTYMAGERYEKFLSPYFAQTIKKTLTL